MALSFPFDPIARSKEVENIIMQGEKRAYYRFRYADFYGGIITADAIGCNLLCAPCWNYERNANPAASAAKGMFLSPQEAAKKIVALCAKNDCWKVRVSGAEPILGERSARHFVSLLEACDEINDYGDSASFILETNGVILGYMPEILDMLPKGLYIRLSIKADTDQDFERFTGAASIGLAYQRKAIEEIKKRGFRYNVAYMRGFVDPQKLVQAFDISGYQLEEESLRLYGRTKARLRERGLVVGAI